MEQMRTELHRLFSPFSGRKQWLWVECFMQLRTAEGSCIFFWFTPRSSIDYDRQIWWNSSGTVRNFTWPWGIDWYRNKTKFVKCWRNRQKKRYSFWQHRGLHKVKIVIGLSLIQIGFKICISSKSRFQYKRIKGFPLRNEQEI